MYLCTFINKKNLLVMKVDIPKSETPKFVSNAKNRISKSMSKILSLIPVSLLVGGAIVVSCLFATGCQKGTNCPDGYDHSIMKSPPKSAMSDDPCEEERNAVNTADSLLNQVYAWDVRNAIEPALYEPSDISSMYWGQFNAGIPCETLLDSVGRHIIIIDYLWKTYGNPLPSNDENIQILYDNCGIYLTGYEDLETKKAALEECESNVGITEYEWVKDDCGGYWTIK